MAVKIRLARKGRKKKPFYHIVIADARSPRDGKFIEKIGSYNPLTVPATIELDRDRAYEWLVKGAVPTDTARAILKFKGVMYKKHLMRGVTKGVLTEEKAMEMYQQWIDTKESKIAARREEEKKKREDFWKRVSGEIKPMQTKVVDEATKEAFTEDAPAATEQPAEAVEAVAEAPVVEAEAAPEAPVAEAPAAEEKPAEDKPADETPVAEEKPAEEAPVAEEAKAEASSEEE